MHYVIVGNGILALSTAFRLTQRLRGSDKVSIIGPRSRPGAATLAAAAMLNSFAEISAYSLKSDPDRYHFELSRAAAQRWPGFEQEIVKAAKDALPSGVPKIESLSRGEADRGTYIINNAAADDWDDKNFDALVRVLTEFHEPFEYVHSTDIPNYLPMQRLRAMRAVYIPGEGWLNPRLVLGALEAILDHTDSVTVVDEKARRLVKNGSTISAVELESGKMVEGDVFLLANGAAASAVLTKSELGLNIQPVFYGEGISLEIKAEGHPHKKCVRTTNRGGACGVYSVPLYLGANEPDDHIVIGASNRVVEQPMMNGRLGSMEYLLHGAIHEINEYFYAARFIRVNVGWRPTTLDTYPLLGKTSISNFHIATGTKRDGFHLSPLLSEYLSVAMVGEHVDERLQMFAPERSVIRDISREDGVEMAVSSLMSEQYQHGYIPSNVLMNTQVRATYKKDIEALYDRIGAKDWGIPPELLGVYRRMHPPKGNPSESWVQS